MSGSRGFPRLLHEGCHTVFGRPSDVLVMEMLGKSVEQKRFAKEMPSQMLLEGTSYSRAKVRTIDEVNKIISQR